jgi:hypothetical protein
MVGAGDAQERDMNSDVQGADGSYDFAGAAGLRRGRPCNTAGTPACQQCSAVADDFNNEERAEGRAALEEKLRRRMRASH